ncbi:hypothetical protein SAMD00023353_0202780 [Rosellinia necatrix]|uniref:RhoGAP domain-containing protein n=1 Tax=Rosellinia necatrix TaxID=77044 RepID=A0A1S7UJD5_ROSNE|nr:hypothetical protein SAMD00023353_0202780 [Rosellinia necatrix]
MSHLITLRRSETPPSSQVEQQAAEEGIQDSPTIGRAAPHYSSDDYGLHLPPTSPLPSTPTTKSRTSPTTATTPVSSLSIPFVGKARSQRKAAPSPLQTSVANRSPSVSPSSTSFPSPAIDSLAPSPLPSPAVSRSAVQSPQEDQRLPRPHHSTLGGTSFLEISPPATPVTATSGSTPRLPPNDSKTLPSPVTRTKPVGSAPPILPNMASAPSLTKVDGTRAAPRTSSIDSAVSAISSRAPSQQSSQDDIAHLIRAAGTPEAVIQYLLKEKQSQSQQNAQLWRLVDKQRAMILGLNKDLDRALKDKDKYRKKLKEVIAIHDDHIRPDTSSSSIAGLGIVEVKVSKPEHGNAPRSPSNLDSDSTKNSPVDMAVAPYPITPPADRMTNETQSKVGELLDPTHSMPKASEHALDHFDHEEQDRAADAAKNAMNAAHELPIDIGLPPSRSLPSRPPPRQPQPKPPTVSIIEATPLIDQGISQFPPPPAPPPRRPPPAPLQLNKKSSITHEPVFDEGIDSESDYDSLLEVDELPITETRGRRRTREDDDHEREIIAQQEAEARSLSKKSKKGSQKGTPIAEETRSAGLEVPISPRTKAAQPSIVRDNAPASLASVLSGNGSQQRLHPAVMSPGLPSSPRPSTFSPPLSPRSMNSTAGPLSPRAPRHPIPLPPNTPKFHAASTESMSLASPKPLQVVKQTQEPEQPTRTEIFHGFITEEYPDLLLPPNALPSIAVKVASSRMRPSRASLLSLTQLEEDPVFTLGILSRNGDGELWRVEKDTSSLVKLDQRMKQCASFTSKTPDRSLFSGHSPAKLDARRTVLDNYLDELLNTPLDLPTAVELCKYLSTNALPPNSDDTSLPNDATGEAGPQKSPCGRPFKTGYLTKRGKNFGGWKARYFVLDGPNLKYYETPGGAHLGTIKLQHAQIGKQAQHNTDGPAGGSNGDETDNQYRHAFLVLEPKKKDASSYVKHVLCAESDQERDQWVDTLLQWINYQDPNEEEPSVKSATHGPNSQPHVTGANAKKKMYAQGKSQDPRNESQDALIGMSYDTAKQGDIPDGAPLRRRGTASPELAERPTASLYTISAPRDPHIISDSALWGSKTSLLLPGPSTEEKKQRKRSFFGFGPKARSSTDDQDPLYNSSGGSTPQPQPESRGPLRQVFGAPLAEAVRYCGPADTNVPLPAVVYRCIQYLDLKNAILEEGIFRLSGSNVVIKQLRERFNQEGDVNLATDDTLYDIHAVASLLKLYLRELPTTILTRDLHMQFVAITEMTDLKEKIAALSELVERLPLANETLLKYLIAFLVKIINHSNTNKMTVRNVGIVFSPTLNIPAPVFALLLQNYQGIFGIDPEEYELPSPVSEADSRAAIEVQPRRPSTAGPTESPHRQRLVEQVQQRSTPTPPGYRTTGTPPPRQTANLQTTTRPAYESGFSVPPGYDPNTATIPAFKQPTYDRPHYGYGSPYEQDYSPNSNGMLDASFGNKSKRRESSMFMGNVMHHQASNSRLREETRM